MDATDTRLECQYRHWLRCYPGWYRRDHEDEILEVLLAGHAEGSHRPDLAECWDLVRGAIGLRLRPRIARSQRSAWSALRLVYLAAIMQFAVGLTVVSTAGRLHAVQAERDPGYTASQWHLEVAGTVHPLAIECGIGFVALVAMAWAQGRAERWIRLSATVGVVVLLLITTDSVLTGLGHGPAVDTKADLLMGILLWLVEFAALVAAVRSHLSPIAETRAASASRR
jgi:hypothetical protein